MAVYISFVKPSMGSVWGACGKKVRKIMKYYYTFTKLAIN